VRERSRSRPRHREPGDDEYERVQPQLISTNALGAADASVLGGRRGSVVTERPIVSGSMSDRLREIDRILGREREPDSVETKAGEGEREEPKAEYRNIIGAMEIVEPEIKETEIAEAGEFKEIV